MTTCRNVVPVALALALMAFVGCAGDRTTSPSPPQSSGQPTPYPSTGIERWDDPNARGWSPPVAGNARVPISPQSPGPPTPYPSTGIELWDAPAPSNLSPQAGSGVPEPLTPEDEQNLIDLAKEHLEMESGKTVVGDFKASRTDKGYSVFVQFHAGYDDQGRPLSTVGGHCLVLISKDREVIQVIGGA